MPDTTIDVAIETFCSIKHETVKIILKCKPEDAKGELVTGKPYTCQHEATCLEGDRCLLKALQITTRRK